MFPQRCASEETVITRLGALCSSRPSKRLVSKNGARWFIASVYAILCLGPLALDQPSVVGEYVEPVVALLKLLGQSPDLGPHGKVGQHQLHGLTVTLRFYLLDRGLAALGVAPDNDDIGAHRR